MLAQFSRTTDAGDTWINHSPTTTALLAVSFIDATLAGYPVMAVRSGELQMEAAIGCFSTAKDSRDSSAFLFTDANNVTAVGTGSEGIGGYLI